MLKYLYFIMGFMLYTCAIAQTQSGILQQNFLASDYSIAVNNSTNFKENPFAKIHTDQKPIKIKNKSSVDDITNFSVDTETNKNKELQTADYEEKLKYLQALRYEVFSLKQQLGKDIAESIPYDDYLYKKTSAKKFNALAQSYNDASKKSGLFAGLGIGVVDIYTSGNVDNEFVITRITPIIYNLNGGYQKFFNHYMGVRLYGGISTSLFSDVQRYNINNGEYQMVPNPYNAGGNIQSFYALGTISADFLFEFPLTNTFRHYIGGFAGINIGFMYYRPYATHPQKGSYYPASYIWNYNLQVDYSFNLGMNFTVFDIHRIEFHLSIPFSYLSLPGLAESANIMETVPAQFWRSAIFSLNYKMIIHFKKK